MHEEDIYKSLSGKEQFKLLKRLMIYTKPYKWQLISAMGLVVATILFDLYLPTVLAALMSRAQKNDIEMDTVIILCTGYIMVAIVSAIIKYVHFYIFSRSSQLIVKDIRVDLFTKVQTMGMRYFDQTPVGSIVSRITNDTASIEEMGMNVLSEMFSGFVTMMFVVIFMLFINPYLALIAVVFLPISLSIMVLYQKFSTKHYQHAREMNSQLNTKLAESISGMGIIQQFNQEARVKAEFEKTNTKYYRSRLKSVLTESLLLGPAIDFLMVIAQFSALTYFGILSTHSPIDIGMVYIFNTYTRRFFFPIYGIMEKLSIYQQAIVAVQRIFIIKDHEGVAPQQSNKQTELKKGCIVFDNVSFAYDDHHYVLKNISFEVNQGEMIAIVGRTGSGKSSIINMMMRFYEFHEGDITIDGVSIKDYTTEILREKIGLVLQDPFLYYGSIIDNIRLSNRSVSDEAVMAACEFVQANSFIEAFEDGYHHQVIERGAAFSSGQKQLLAFARTMVLNPKILIMDEATASIDTETEQLIQNGLQKARNGRTTIAIAHRLSTIKDADKILVLEDGCIVEQGTHQSLIDLKGTYYAMYQLQQNESALKEMEA